MDERSQPASAEMDAAAKAALRWLKETIERNGSEPDSANKIEACRLVLSAAYGVEIQPCNYATWITHRFRL